MRGSNLERTICNCLGGPELAENARLAGGRLGGAQCKGHTSSKIRWPRRKSAGCENARPRHRRDDLRALVIDGDILSGAGRQFIASVEEYGRGEADAQAATCSTPPRPCDITLLCLGSNGDREAPVAVPALRSPTRVALSSRPARPVNESAYSRVLVLLAPAFLTPSLLDIVYRARITPMCLADDVEVE